MRQALVLIILFIYKYVQGRTLELSNAKGLPKVNKANKHWIPRPLSDSKTPTFG